MISQARARKRTAPGPSGSPETYRESNAYIMSEQDKPPDFAFEIGSRSTGQQDAVEKRA